MLLSPMNLVTLSLLAALSVSGGWGAGVVMAADVGEDTELSAYHRFSIQQHEVRVISEAIAALRSQFYQPSAVTSEALHFQSLAVLCRRLGEGECDGVDQFKEFSSYAISEALWLHSQMAPRRSKDAWLDHLGSVLSVLDPHTVMLSPEQWQDLADESHGSMLGLGLTVEMDRGGYPEVIKLERKSPAKRLGLKVGDKIVAINGESMSRPTGAKITAAFDGDSPVDLTVISKQTGITHHYRLPKESVKLESVDIQILDRHLTVTHAPLRKPTYLMIKIAYFSSQTASELIEKWRDIHAEAKGIEALAGIVLDLRENPGGVLGEAIKVADLFLSRGELMSVRWQGTGSQIHRATEQTLIPAHLPLVALVNHTTASSAEILASALQHHGRAVVVGDKTASKHSIQILNPLPSGYGLKVTAGHFTSPHGKGAVRPDFEMNPLPQTQRWRSRPASFCRELKRRQNPWLYPFYRARSSDLSSDILGLEQHAVIKQIVRDLLEGRSPVRVQRKYHIWMAQGTCVVQSQRNQQG